MQQTQRKPKKLVIQVLVAAIIAIVVGIGAIALFMTVLGGITNNAQKVQAEAKKKLDDQEAEINRLRADQARKASSQSMRPVISKQVQAVSDISAGEPITLSLVGEVELPAGSPPSPGAFSRTADVLGKVAKNNIVSGEALTSAKVIDSSSVLQVKEGMRAVTVGIDNLASLNGALMPGAFVDILMTVDGPGGALADGSSISGGGSMLKTLLQNIQVIAVTSASNGGGVTFLVSPPQAEMLVLAGQKTKLTLALRNFKDKARAKVSGADLDRLVTGYSIDVTGKPSAPKGLKKGQGSFNNQNVPVTYTPQPLPSPEIPAQPAGGKRSIKMYTGSGTQTVNFD